MFVLILDYAIFGKFEQELFLPFVVEVDDSFCILICPFCCKNCAKAKFVMHDACTDRQSVGYALSTHFPPFRAAA